MVGNGGGGIYTKLALNLTLEMSQEARVAMRKYCELMGDKHSLQIIDDYEFELYKEAREKRK